MSAKHTARDIPRAVYEILAVVPDDGSETNLSTLTDHPRLAASPLRVFSSEARVSDVSVLESINTVSENE